MTDAQVSTVPLEITYLDYSRTARHVGDSRDLRFQDRSATRREDQIASIPTCSADYQAGIGAPGA